MSVDVSNAVWKHSKQRGSNLVFLLAIADNANDDGWAWPNPDKLAAKTRLRVRDVRYIRDKLIAAGELIWVEGRGRGHLTRYGIPLYPDEDSYAPAECHEDHHCNGRHSPMSDPDTTPGYYGKKRQSNAPITEKRQSNAPISTEKGQNPAQKGAKSRTSGAEKGQNPAQKGAKSRTKNAPAVSTSLARRDENVIVTPDIVTSVVTAHARGNKNTPPDENDVSEAEREPEADSPQLREAPLIVMGVAVTTPDQSGFQRWLHALSIPGSQKYLPHRRRELMGRYFAAWGERHQANLADFVEAMP